MGSFESHLRAVWPLKWAWRPGPSLFYPVHLDDFGGEGWDIYFRKGARGYHVELVHWFSDLACLDMEHAGYSSRCHLDAIGWAMEKLRVKLGYLPGYEEEPP